MKSTKASSISVCVSVHGWEKRVLKKRITILAVFKGVKILAGAKTKTFPTNWQ